MKKYIYENYGIKVSKIYDDYFFYGSDKLYIVKSDKDESYINELVNITNELYNHNIFINTFILTKNKKFYNKKDNFYIALLKTNDREKEITYEDIKEYKFRLNNLSIFDFKKYFENEIDSLEELVAENSQSKIVNDSINYFIGLSENAIQLLNEYKNENVSLVHNIKIKNYTKEEFNNPFNLLKGNYTYDIANYIKYRFYSDSLDYEELYKILIDIMDINSQIFLFANLLYPNYYIEEVKYVLETNDDKNLKKIIKNISKYEELLDYCKIFLKNNEIISSIDWLFE